MKKGHRKHSHKAAIVKIGYHARAMAMLGRRLLWPFAHGSLSHRITVLGSWVGGTVVVTVLVLIATSPMFPVGR